MYRSEQVAYQKANNVYFTGIFMWLMTVACEMDSLLIILIQNATERAKKTKETQPIITTVLSINSFSTSFVFLVLLDISGGRFCRQVNYKT